MKASGTPTPPQNNLDESEQRSYSLPSLQADAEELLAELARRVDTSHSLFARSLLPPDGRTGTEPSLPLENAALKPSNDMAADEVRGTAAVVIEAPSAFKFGNVRLSIKTSALALAVAALLIGAAFGLKHGVLGPSKAPPFVAAADGSSKGLLPNGQTTGTSSDAGASQLTGIPQPVEVKGIIPDQPPIELDDHASVGKAPSSGPLSAAAINVAPLLFAAAPATPQFPGPKALPTLSVGPSGTQMATGAPSASDESEALHARDEAQRPPEAVRKGAGGGAGPAQLSKNKLGLPTKLSGKPLARLVVAKTETAGLASEAENAPPAVARPAAATQAPPPAPQPVNPLSRAFGDIVGALRARAGSSPQSAVKAVPSEEQPIERGDHDSLGNAAPPASLAPASAGAAQPTTGAPARPSVAAAVNTPVAAPPTSAPSPIAPQFPKPNTKPSAPVVFAKTETAAPGPAAEKTSGALSAPIQQPVNPLSHAFGHIAGAVRAPSASTSQPVDQIGVQHSSDWALQFAPQKSEAAAEANAVRLNAKYVAALNGAKIGVSKILSNGQTSYAPRVSGLSTSDVAALCQRLKGRDCFIAK